MREERITKFMAFEPGGVNPNYSRAVEAFLASYTEPEFVVGNVQVARYKPAWRFSEELVKNGDFADGLKHWDYTPTAHDAVARTVSVTVSSPIVQRVPIDDRVVYRYAITAQCTNSGTNIRLWLGWYGARRQHVGTTVHVRRCGNAQETFAEEVTPPEGAVSADLIVAGHEADRPVEVSKVSLSW
jgi:hypothetical protein